MDGYVRQSGLDYVRMFVSATTGGKSNESTEFLAQLAELEHYYPEQRDAYEGRFWRLLRLTAPKEDWLRGYLLDAGQRPLTATRMAARLHLSVPVMKQTLAALKRVGLIEYVQCPKFEQPERGKKEDKKKGASKDKGVRPGRGKSGQAGLKTPKKRAIRGHSKTFENVSESFKKSESDKSNKIGIGNRNEYEEKILGLSSSDKITTRQCQRDRHRTHGQGPSQDRTSTSPATTPPICPTVSDEVGSDFIKSNRKSQIANRKSNMTVSDEGDSAKVIPFAGSPGSVDDTEAASIYDGIQRVKARLNPQAESAAIEIYRELGGPWPLDDSRETAQDLGAIRNAFVRVFESGLPHTVANELWESMIREAKQLRKIYCANGGYQKAKRTWFKPILRDKLAARLKAM